MTVKNLGAILLRKNSSIGVINYALYIGTTVGVPASNSEDAGHCGRTLCPLLATTQHLPPRLRLEDVSSIFCLLFTIYYLLQILCLLSWPVIRQQEADLVVPTIVVGLLLDWRM